MFKVTNISYNKEGHKQFTVLDTSDGVKENLSMALVQKARIMGIKLENLPKYELYPFKTEQELMSYWSSLKPDYIQSIISILKMESRDIKFPNTVRVYVYGWTKSNWYDAGIPKYLEVKCDSVIELTSQWLFFCNKVFLNFDCIDHVEVVK